MSAIRIYVACLAAYNEGHLHGRWIDAAQGEAHIWELSQAMLKASPIEAAEEWAIHDYEGFEGAELSEYSSFETVAAIAEFITEHGALGGKLLAHFSGHIADAKTALENYYGQYESLKDYARSLTEETTAKIPEHLKNYIDYTAMGRDMDINGDVFTVETAPSEIHIFGGHS